MTFRFYLILFLFLTLYGDCLQLENVPCSVRTTPKGYICVCNATYCDTIERPANLSRGLYYHYATSKDSPGFSVSVGQFINITQTNFGTYKDVFIRVNSSIQYQTFEGFGASFTAGSGIMINSLPLETQQKFIETYFSEFGLEYTFARVPISASDFSPRYYTYDDVNGDVDLKHFNLTEEDFELKIPLLKNAVSASKRGMKLIGSSWTAPNWMKTNNEYRYGYIYSKYLEVWANYHLKFLQAYKQNKLEFWGITQGNEVLIAFLFGHWLPIQNTILLPNQARYWTKKYLGPLLKSSGFKNIKILILDDQRPFMPWYTDRMFADEEAAEYVDGVPLHWYLDRDSNLYNLDNFHAKHPNKFLLYTEASINRLLRGGAAVELGDWSRAEKYIKSIISNLDHWVVGYIDWNIALNDQGGPTGPANLTLDAAIIINNTNGEFYKQPFFYAMGHFSKFLPPGSKKINVVINQPFDNGDYYFRIDENHAVRSNLEDEPPINETTRVPFPTQKPEPPITTILAIASSNPDGSHTVIAYNPRPEAVNLIVTDVGVGVLNQTVAPHSLNTFVYW